MDRRSFLKKMGVAVGVIGAVATIPLTFLRKKEACIAFDLAANPGVSQTVVTVWGAKNSPESIRLDWDFNRMTYREAEVNLKEAMREWMNRHCPVTLPPSPLPKPPSLNLSKEEMAMLGRKVQVM